MNRHLFPAKKDRPNLLTLGRFVAAPLICLFLIKDASEWHAAALLLCYFAMWTDYYDGHLSRKWNCTSPIGEYIDPLADKAVFYFVGIALDIHDLIPEWFIPLCLARDFGVGYFRTCGVKTTSFAQVKMAMQFFFLLGGITMILFSPESSAILPAWEIVVWVVAGVTLATLLHYFCAWITMTSK